MSDASSKARARAWRFVDLFVEGARDHLSGARQQAGIWRVDGGATPSEAFRRHAHSLRGMAGTLGLTAMTEIGRRLEKLGLAAIPPAEIDAALAALTETVESIAASGTPDESAAAAVVERWTQMGYDPPIER